MTGDYQKHHLHEALSVKRPPNSGPTTPEHPNVTPTIPIYAALYCGFAVIAIMINAPLIIPAPPIPLIALPTTTAVELVAVAQRTFPISKITPASKKLALRGKYLYAFPHEDRKAKLVSEYALEYQTTLLKLPNSAVMEGMAVEIMVESSAERKMVKMMERVRRMNLKPVTDDSFWLAVVGASDVTIRFTFALSSSVIDSDILLKQGELTDRVPVMRSTNETTKRGLVFLFGYTTSIRLFVDQLDTWN